MQLMPLPLNQGPYSVSHFFDQELVKFTVEVIPLTLGKTTNTGFLSLKVLLHNTDNRFLHFLFKDMVLALSIDLVEELFLLLLKYLGQLFVVHFSTIHILIVLLPKKIIELFCK